MMISLEGIQRLGRYQLIVKQRTVHNDLRREIDWRLVRCPSDRHPRTDYPAPGYVQTSISQGLARIELPVNGFTRSSASPQIMRVLVLVEVVGISRC